MALQIKKSIKSFFSNPFKKKSSGKPGVSGESTTSTFEPENNASLNNTFDLPNNSSDENPLFDATPNQNANRSSSNTTHTSEPSDTGTLTPTTRTSYGKDYARIILDEETGTFKTEPGSAKTESEVKPADDISDNYGTIPPILNNVTPNHNDYERISEINSSDYLTDSAGSISPPSAVATNYYRTLVDDDGLENMEVETPATVSENNTGYSSTTNAIASSTGLYDTVQSASSNDSTIYGSVPGKPRESGVNLDSVKGMVAKFEALRENGSSGEPSKQLTGLQAQKHAKEALRSIAKEPSLRTPEAENADHRKGSVKPT